MWTRNKTCVMKKQTSSGFIIGLYITLFGEKALEYINQESYFLNDWRIPCYFDTKFTTVVQIEQILWRFKSQKLPKFWTPKRSVFLLNEPVPTGL